MAIFNTVPPLAAGSGIEFDGEVISTRAAPRNLLDNSDFLHPVNQRGQTTYTGATYGIDRWRTWETNARVTVTGSGVRVEDGSLNQYLEENAVSGWKTYTVACEEDNGTVHVKSGVLENGIYGGIITFTIDGDKQPWVQIASGKTYVWAALYEGAYTKETLPAYQPKGEALERLACSRFFVRADAWREIYGNISWDGQIIFFLPTSTEMRISPTGTIFKGTLYANGNTVTINEFAAVIIKTSAGLQIIMQTTTEANARHNCTLSIGDTAVYFSADL